MIYYSTVLSYVVLLYCRGECPLLNKCNRTAVLKKIIKYEKKYVPTSRSELASNLLIDHLSEAGETAKRKLRFMAYYLHCYEENPFWSSLSSAGTERERGEEDRMFSSPSTQSSALLALESLGFKVRTVSFSISLYLSLSLSLSLSVCLCLFSLSRIALYKQLTHHGPHDSNLITSIFMSMCRSRLRGACAVIGRKCGATSKV